MFFIVLDLRLTKVGLSGALFLCPYANSPCRKTEASFRGHLSLLLWPFILASMSIYPCFYIGWSIGKHYGVECGHSLNRVGGKRSSFLPTFVFRPLTPPYVPLGIRRFRAFSSYDVWQVVFSHAFEIHHFYPIVGFRPIVWVESSFRTSDYKRLAGWQSFTFALLDSALPF